MPLRSRLAPPGALLSLGLAACSGAPAQPTPTPEVVVETTPEPMTTVVSPDEAPPAPEVDVATTDFDAIASLEHPRQRSTPPARAAQRRVVLRAKWKAKVGLTTFRSTMVFTQGRIVIGTHGRSLDGKGESDDGVHVLDARTGKVVRVIPSPGTGDRDVGGVAVDGEDVYFGTDNGLLVGARLDGNVRWTAAIGGKVRPAPALGDLNGDGAVEVVVGDEKGRLHVYDSRTGRRLWQKQTGTNLYGNGGFIGAAALVDVDGDRRLDVVAGARDGVLRAYRGRDGHILWEVKRDSGMHASPSVGDFDGDGKPEVLAAWSYSDIGIFDAHTGAQRWSQELSLDSGGIEGLFGSPVPLPGRPGVLVQGTSWWGNRDGIVGVGAVQRTYRSTEGRVSSTAVVTDLDGDGTSEAILGTEAGDLVAVNADGQRWILSHVGRIEAPAMLADVDGNGTFELLVAADDHLLCFDTNSRTTPFISRFRGNDPHNTGQLGAVRLHWSPAPAQTPPPGSKGQRDDYVGCCQALASEANIVPRRYANGFMQASSQCMAMASRGAEKNDMIAAVRKLTQGRPLPLVCR